MRNPGNYSIEISHSAECAFQRAIIQGKYSFVKDEEIKWIDIELPVDKSNAARGKCIDLIGKDEQGNYVLCELKFRKKSDNGCPCKATNQLRDYFKLIEKNAAYLNEIGLRHTNATEDIDWTQVASPKTRLMVVANEFYWKYWLARYKKEEIFTDKKIEYYSVNIDSYIFNNQKGEKKRYEPKMPQEGFDWTEKR